MRVGVLKAHAGSRGGARTTNLRVGRRHRAGGHGLAPSVLAGAELRLLAALGRRGRAHRAAPHGGPGWPVGWITRGSGVSLNKRGTNASRVRGARGRASVAKGRVPRRRVRATRKHTLARGKRGECPGRPAGTARLARLETYLTALRPRADMCDARPDDAASEPARAVREVDEPAVYPDTARHVVAIAIAPPAGHDMSVGARIRRYACAAICAQRASGVAPRLVTRRSGASAASRARRFRRAVLWARNAITVVFSGRYFIDTDCPYRWKTIFQ